MQHNTRAENKKPRLEIRMVRAGVSLYVDCLQQSLSQAALLELQCHKDTLELSISVWWKTAIKVINQMCAFTSTHDIQNTHTHTNRNTQEHTLTQSRTFDREKR